MEELKNKLTDFAEGLGLKLIVSHKFEGMTFEFIRLSDNKHLTYNIGHVIDNYDTTFVQIVYAVIHTFVGVVEEPKEKAMKTVKLENLAEQFCTPFNMSKNEYIALELTKAWATLRHRSHYDTEDIVGCYLDMLEEVEKRNDASKTKSE